MNPGVSETEIIFFPQRDGSATAGCAVKKAGQLYNSVRSVIQSADCSREEYITTGQFFSVSIQYSLFSNTTELFLLLDESPSSLKFSTLEAVLGSKHLLTTILPHYVLFFQEMQFLI